MNTPPELPAEGAAVRGLDGVAMALSLLCLLHCLALPLVIGLLPLAAASVIGNEQAHVWLLAAAVPTSVLALVAGWRWHRDAAVAWLGGIGLGLMLLAVVAIRQRWIGAGAEQALTLAGAGLLAFAHWRNYRRRGEPTAAAASDPA